MKIAVIGSGVSGLVCAHLLDREHEVTVYEADDRPGGHTHTVSVPTPSGAEQPIDTGFIVFNDRTYPGLERLLGELGVAWADTDMSFSVSDERSGLEYAGGLGLGALLAQPANAVCPSFLRMVRDILRFNREAQTLLSGSGDGDIPVGRYLDRGGYSREFTEYHLVPASAAIWSADPEQLREEMPIGFLVRFFDNHGMLAVRGRPQWRYIPGGSRRYVEAIVERLRGELRLATPVESVARDDDGVTVKATGRDAERYDEVVLACHADQALAMLDDADADERRLLGAFGFRPNEAVLHTDERLLPTARRAWASWNYHLSEGSREPTLTYHMNRLQRIESEREYCVTLNRSEAIDPATVLATVDYQHPVYTRAGVAAQREHATLIRHRRTSTCGAWWRWGFHEDGVQSALRVCEAFGAGLDGLTADTPERELVPAGAA
ncbi:MAG: NAD(P)/FAD-dependent oxidoreductase [Solirubrobacterales bacterium]